MWVVVFRFAVRRNDSLCRKVDNVSKTPDGEITINYVTCIREMAYLIRRPLESNGFPVFCVTSRPNSSIIVLLLEALSQVIRPIYR